MKPHCLVSLVLLLTMPVYADKAPMPTDALKSYEAECASCHMAYPPGFLGQKNWQNIMAGLGKQFGSDASLDTKTETEITNWFLKIPLSPRCYKVRHISKSSKPILTRRLTSSATRSVRHEQCTNDRECTWHLRR